MGNKDIFLSIVIPAYNEEHTLPLCLQSLCEQATSLPFEVIVVDNASTDGTVRQAKKFAKKLRLRIIPESTKGRSPARRTPTSSTPARRPSR